MSRHQFTDDMAEISGLGGEYEAMCRRMVIARLTGTEIIDVPSAAMSIAVAETVEHIHQHGWESYCGMMRLKKLNAERRE